MADIADLLTREQGKPLPDSEKEIRFGVEVIRYYAEEGRRIEGSLRASTRADIRSLVVSSPVGVVGAITPWNYPVDHLRLEGRPGARGGLYAGRQAAARDAARHRPRRALLRGGGPAGRRAERRAGTTPDAGAALASHPDVRMITATASVRAGQSMMRAAADTMKRLTLELGGQCPFVVLDDADVAEAAAAAARRSFSNMGQICIAVNRILVAAPLYDAFLAALAAEAEKIRLGHGVEPGVLYGPVLHEGVRARTRAASRRRAATRRAARRRRRAADGGGIRRRLFLPPDGHRGAPTIRRL